MFVIFRGKKKEINNKKIFGVKFVQAFLKLQNEEVISLLESMLTSEAKNHFQPMSVETLHQRIDISEKDFEKGDFNTHKDVFAKYES